MLGITTQQVERTFQRGVHDAVSIIGDSSLDAERVLEWFYGIEVRNWWKFVENFFFNAPFGHFDDASRDFLVDNPSLSRVIAVMRDFIRLWRVSLEKVYRNFLEAVTTRYVFITVFEPDVTTSEIVTSGLSLIRFLKAHHFQQTSLELEKLIVDDFDIKHRGMSPQMSLFVRKTKIFAYFNEPEKIFVQSFGDIPVTQRDNALNVLFHLRENGIRTCSAFLSHFSKNKEEVHIDEFRSMVAKICPNPSKVDFFVEVVGLAFVQFDAFRRILVKFLDNVRDRFKERQLWVSFQYPELFQRETDPMIRVESLLEFVIDRKLTHLVFRVGKLFETCRFNNEIDLEFFQNLEKEFETLIR